MILPSLSLSPQLSAALAACHDPAERGGDGWSLTVEQTTEGGTWREIGRTVRVTRSNGAALSPTEAERVRDVVACHRAALAQAERDREREPLSDLGGAGHGR